MLFTYNSYCLLVLFVTLASTQNLTKTIPLNRNLTYTDKELYGDFIYLNGSSTLQVNFSDVSMTLSFIIFQVHSHLYPIRLYKTNDEKINVVTGTNVGLYSSTSDGLDTFYIQNTQDFNLTLFVSVHGYIDADPIPGGCNMELPNPISPYMKAITHNKTYIIIEASPPQFKSAKNCTEAEWLNIEYRILYLPQDNYDRDAYFDGIRKMSTLKNIKRNGRIIPQSFMRFWTIRRMLSAYPGNGAIYAAYTYDNILINNTRRFPYSVYVPTYSYACSPLVANDCELMDDPMSMILNASFLFIGTFLCYFGHRFFKTQILTVGFLSGFIVTYILLSIMFGINGSALVTASALSGLCVGSLRLVSWWLYGIPVFVIVLSSADIGFLVSSLLYYISLGETPYQVLLENFNFWCLFILVILLITICLLPTSYIASLLCCAVVGSYTAIYPIDYYFGSNLKYILNNTVRRATVPEFNKAVIMPPFQWKDGFLSFVWILLAVTGFWYQYRCNKGRPPFPSPPRSVRRMPEEPVAPYIPERSNPNIETIHSKYADERTPLLG